VLGAAQHLTLEKTPDSAAAHIRSVVSLSVFGRTLHGKYDRGTPISRDALISSTQLFARASCLKSFSTSISVFAVTFERVAQRSQVTGAFSNCPRSASGSELLL